MLTSSVRNQGFIFKSSKKSIGISIFARTIKILFYKTPTFFLFENVKLD